MKDRLSNHSIITPWAAEVIRGPMSDFHDPTDTYCFKKYLGSGFTFSKLPLRTRKI